MTLHTHTHVRTHAHVQHAHMHTHVRTRTHAHTVLLYKHHVVHTYIDHVTMVQLFIHVLFDLLANDLVKRLESVFLQSINPSEWNTSQLQCCELCQQIHKIKWLLSEVFCLSC